MMDLVGSQNIRVMPGKRLSLQLHKHRSEHWVVVKGRGAWRLIGGERCPGEGASIYIGAEVKHRLFNPGGVPLEIIEV